MEKRIENVETNLISLVNLVENLNVNLVEAFNSMDQRFTSMDERLETIDNRLSKLEGNTSKGFQNVTQDIEIFRSEFKIEIKKISDMTGYQQLHDNLKIVK